MSELHSFGPFQLDRQRGVVLREGQSVAVGQRGIALLSALLAAQGQAVTKADLMEAGWPGLAVEEGNLTVQIAGLRKLLGQSPQGQDWIVTVPRTGYRLVLPQFAPAEPDPATRPTLAVLPFPNLSGEAEADYFADGIVADIITALSRFRSLAVVSRNSSFVYKGRAVDTREVARALGAGYLLEGSVRRSGDRLRITAQLVEGGTGVTLWTNRFDGDLTEIFDFQDRITESVASLVAPAIEASEIIRSRKDRPQSAASYDIYLQARALQTTETEPDNAQAYAMLTRVLEREPDNALILSHAVWALEHRHTMGWPGLTGDDVRTCVDLARRAIRLGEGNPLVMAQCAVALVQTGKEYEAGMAVIREAVRANPHDLYVMAAAGVLTMHCGDLDEAEGYLQRFLRLGPNDPDARFPLTSLGMLHIMRGQFAEALRYAERSLSVNDRFDCTYWVLISANAQLGQMTVAQGFVTRLLEIAPTVTLSRIKAGQPSRFPERVGAVLGGLRLAGMPEGDLD